MTINEKSSVSLFAVIVSLPFLVAVVIWLSGVASDAREAKEDVNNIRALVIDTHDKVILIEQQLKTRGK